MSRLASLSLGLLMGTQRRVNPVLFPTTPCFNRRYLVCANCCPFSESFTKSLGGSPLLQLTAPPVMTNRTIKANAARIIIHTSAGRDGVVQLAWLHLPLSSAISLLVIS